MLDVSGPAGCERRRPHGSGLGCRSWSCSPPAESIPTTFSATTTVTLDAGAVGLDELHVFPCPAASKTAGASCPRCALFTWAGTANSMACSVPNYAKPFRKIPTAWAPRRLHLFLRPPTFPAPGTRMTVGTRIKGAHLPKPTRILSSRTMTGYRAAFSRTKLR